MLNFSNVTNSVKHDALTPAGQTANSTLTCSHANDSKLHHAQIQKGYSIITDCYLTTLPAYNFDAYKLSQVDLIQGQVQ
jgi:hypothetical protein